jgi:DDE family transposase
LLLIKLIDSFRIESMYIESVPNRSSPPAILLRESFREGGKVRKRTLANLSDWPTELVEGLRTLLKGGKAIAADQDPVTILRSLPHGHIAAALGTLRAVGLDTVLGPAGNRCRDLVIAMILSRFATPQSKLATARAINPGTEASSIGPLLGLGVVEREELYRALDWLLDRQGAIEKTLAKRHLNEGVLVLYDVSSSYLEGRCCPLGQRGYSRDGKKGKLQIVYGLLCAADGCPVAVEVFEGNTGDPATLAAQIVKIKHRFGLNRVVLVGDRGMITEARLEEEIKPAALDWITALRAPAIRGLVEGDVLQLSLFDQRNIASITAPEFPGERLIVCRNPDLAGERARRRQELLAATERDLAVIKARVDRRRAPLHGQDAIGLAVGAVLNKHKMAKHFDLAIGERSFTFARKTDAIAAEAALDGLYVVRTNLPSEVLGDAEAVLAYKSLAKVERAFRTIKTGDLEVRPVFHWATPRVKAHVLLCMLAYYVEHHMLEKLAPMLYRDTDPAAAQALRDDVVTKAQRSPAAMRKDATHTTTTGLPAHSFQGLMAHLATYCRLTATTPLNDKYQFTLYTKPTPTQEQAFSLLGINPERTQ